MNFATITCEIIIKIGDHNNVVDIDPHQRTHTRLHMLKYNGTFIVFAVINISNN